jgi:ZIP family zinc transporter
VEGDVPPAGIPIAGDGRSVLASGGDSASNTGTRDRQASETAQRHAEEFLNILTILYLTLLAGACIPVGGLLASFERIRPHWLEKELRHFVIAFGGGILLGAVAVILVPEGIERMGHSHYSIVLFIAGGVSFFVIERLLGLRRREAPQFMGLILDYIPEAIALGGMVALGSASAPLLAILIGLQNLPEGFNAYRELKRQTKSSSVTLAVMLALVPVGPLAGLAGHILLSGREAVLGAIMMFASGGILYLIFQDIAPQSRLKKHWAPSLGAVLGFCLALFAKMVTPGG